MTPEVLKANITQVLESLTAFPVGNNELSVPEYSTWLAQRWLANAVGLLNGTIEPYSPKTVDELNYEVVSGLQSIVSDNLKALRTLRNNKYPHNRLSPIANMTGEVPALFIDDVFISIQQAINCLTEAGFALDLVAIDYPAPAPEPVKEEAPAEPEQPVQQPEAPSAPTAPEQPEPSAPAAEQPQEPTALSQPVDPTQN